MARALSETLKQCSRRQRGSRSPTLKPAGVSKPGRIKPRTTPSKGETTLALLDPTVLTELTLRSRLDLASWQEP